jgi:hypothetical protein
MGVFRQRLVFRDAPLTRLLGSQSIVTATAVAALIAFGGTASGNTSVTTGEASGSIVVSAAPITEIVLEVSSTGPVVFAGTAGGLQVSPATGSASLVLGGTAYGDSVATGAITFGGTATVGSVFTMDTSAAIAFAGTAAPAPQDSQASGEVVFAGTVSSGVISGGTVEANASGTVAFAGSALGTVSNITVGEITFSGTAEGRRSTNYRTPPHRCINIFPRRPRR